jgi:hypothetical protein
MLQTIGRGFEIQWGEWSLSIYLILPAAIGPGVYSVSNRNVYQKQKNIVSGGVKQQLAHKDDNLTKICELSV